MLKKIGVTCNGKDIYGLSDSVALTQDGFVLYNFFPTVYFYPFKIEDTTTNAHVKSHIVNLKKLQNSKISKITEYESFDDLNITKNLYDDYNNIAILKKFDLKKKELNNDCKT